MDVKETKKLPNAKPYSFMVSNIHNIGGHLGCFWKAILLKISNYAHGNFKNAEISYCVLAILLVILLAISDQSVTLVV